MPALAVASVCSTKAAATAARPQVSAPALLVPRLKAAAVATAAAALLGGAAPAFAADLALGEEVFNNNCGGPPSCSLQQGSGGRDVHDVEAPGSSTSSRGLLSRPRMRMLVWQPMPPPAANQRGAASWQLLQAACHMGGNNSVQVEKTLRRAALEQYLDGGFNQDAIIYQVENGKNAMPAWEGRLSEEEIQAVAAFVFKQAEGDLW